MSETHYKHGENRSSAQAWHTTCTVEGKQYKSVTESVWVRLCYTHKLVCDSDGILPGSYQIYRDTNFSVIPLQVDLI